MQFVKELQGRKYYNDSKATNTLATKSALVADKPAHGRTGHYIAREMLTRANSRHHNGGGQEIGNDRNVTRVRILVGNDGCQSPHVDCMARRKARTPPSIGTIFKLTLAVAFERARPVSHQLDSLGHQVDIDQRFEAYQSGLPKVIVVKCGPRKVETRRQRHQGVCRPDARAPGAHRNLAR